jgi:flagellar motor protein MotB
MAKAVNQLARRALGAVCAVPLIAALGSCVAQETYDKAELSAKHYQTQSIRLEAEVARLEEENRRLNAKLDAAGGQILEAGYTDDLEAQLKRLQELAAQSGGQPDDVQKFDVEGGTVYRVTDSILFDLGSAEIRADGQKILAEVADDIRSRARGKIYVRGHTDTVPIKRPETVARFPHGNLQLSADRAVEVAAFLEKQGQVESSRLVVMGFGPSQPVAPNDTEANRRKNRRVEIFVADAP